MSVAGAEPLRVLNAYLERDNTIVAVYRDGEVVRGRRFPAEWVCYLARDEVSEELERDLRESVHVRAIAREEKWLRVSWVDQFARRRMIEQENSPIRKAGAKVYEGDVHPVRRWMVDNRVEVQAPRPCFLDIEVDSSKSFGEQLGGEARVLSWVVVDGATGEPASAVIEEDTDEAEKRLLDELWECLRRFDQVFAWGSPFGDTYDFEVIFARSRARRCKVDARRWLWADYLQLFAKMNMHSASSGDEKSSFKLEDIGQEVVHEGKEPAPDFVRERFGDRSMGSITRELWDLGGEFREALHRYMVKDGVLLWKIERKTGYAALFQTVCEVCYVFGDTTGLAPTRQADGALLRYGADRGHRFPTKAFVENTTKFRGAYVAPPKLDGIEKNIHVGDFKSLYPSIIVTWNMSPDTRAVDVQVTGPIPPERSRAPITGIGFRVDHPGMLALAVSEMLKLRKKWSKAKEECPPNTPEWKDADRRATAYKVTANSFFGVVGNNTSRFFDRATAESIAQVGVWLIKMTISEAEKRGMRAVYTDTDSIFIKGSTRSEFEEFVAYCNDVVYPPAVAAQGCKENLIKLAYEKQFARIVFPRKSDGDTSKKRYAASYVHYGGKDATADSKPEIKGLEYKRGDTLKLAKRLQERVIDMLVGGLKLVLDVPTDDVARYHELLTKARRYVLEKPYLPIDEVKRSQALKQAVHEYAPRVSTKGKESESLHVTVAKVLRERGEDVRQGTRIEYVVVDGASSPMRAIPASDYTGEVDRYYLWEKLVFPPTKRLLEAAFPGYEWSDWDKVRPQKPRGASNVLEGQVSMPGVDMSPKRASVLISGPTPVSQRSLRKRTA